MFEHLAAIAAGYLFAILIGHWAVGTLMRSASGARTATAHSTHPAAIGLLERALYVATWQLGARGFIGLWLALKVLGNWKRWTEDSTPDAGTIPDRSTLNRFLLGAGTSLAFAIGGALIIELLDHNEWAQALLLGAVVVGACLGLGWFLRRGRE
jgi:hypothetical protein